MSDERPKLEDAVARADRVARMGAPAAPNEAARLREELEAIRDKTADELMERTRLLDMQYDDGSVEFVLSSPIVMCMVEMLAESFKRSGAENYLCTGIKVGNNPDEKFTLTIQKTVKPTPHELRQKAEAERDALQSRLAEVERERAWRPIDTAPRDGTEILAWRDDCGVMLVQYGMPIDLFTDSELEGADTESVETPGWFGGDALNSGYRLEGSEMPTQWMPLPRGPYARHAAGEGGGADGD